ncbi:MAG: BatD family protein [Candidatus Omnitrophota bacterium]|nr:BatD family protein [Candidatus Omnitrophota bacterium]
MKRAAFLILLMSVFASYAYADDIKFEAAIDKKTVAIGESAQLGLTFYGTQNVPAPDIGNIDGCEVRYLGPSTMMTVINGTVSNSITHMYKVQPLRLGKFQLGPFTFKYDGNTYTSSIAFITATEERARPEPVKTADEENIVDSLDIKDRLFLTLKVDKTQAYVNEIVPVTIKVYVNRMNVSDIQLPNFNQEGFSKAQFEDPKQYRERMGGLLYDVLEFRTTIFGTRPGDYKLGPATLKCNLAVKKRVRNVSALNDDFLNDQGTGNPYFDDFFTRYERYPVELKSDETKLMLMPLPQEGRPEDFSGAVGDYQFIYSAGPKKVRVGDPVTLKMEINGTGNFNTVIIPKLENTEGFRVYEPQIKTESGKKTFRQVLIPESDKVYQTPKAVFTYFDPEKKIYKTITQEPAPLQVERIAESPAQVIGQAPAIPAATPLTLNAPPEEKKTDSQPQGDILYIKESMGGVKTRGSEFYNSILFLVILLLPFIILATVFVIYAKQDRLKRDTRYAHRTEAFKNMRKEFFELKRHLKSSDSKAFYETLFKAMQDYLGGRLYMPVAGLTFDTVEPVLKGKGIDAAVLNKIKNIFSVCDRAKFALINADTLLMKDDMKELEEVIRDLERFKI